MADYQTELPRELASLLNKYSAESVSGTPDFLLADYLLQQLQVFNAIVVKRADWRGESAEFRPSKNGKPLTHAEEPEILDILENFDLSDVNTNEEFIQKLAKHGFYFAKEA